MNGTPDQDIAVFTEALRLPQEQRGRYLDEACQGDAELRRRVEALLQANEQVGDFLGRSAADRPARAAQGSPPGEKPGDRIGHYRLLQQVGEGGCGVVYMAEQEAPVRRRVALKIIKPGMDTKSVIARFEAERQALALMDHPNIAKVFDAGATESGRPYFVMELVRGVKITDYCDQRSLTTEDRLTLFGQVCQAVQHAHQKGIIHRDIKPSNILVTQSPKGAAISMVIDFGVAKATTGQPLTDKTIFTAFEMLIGTPAYMSPEQATLSSAEVDTRTDIYSLGVLLYELLTDTTPFDTHELLKAGLDEVRRVIREEEPVRPSTRLTSMTAADLVSVSKHHGAEGTKLIRKMRGELDWIVMKALEKDRSRRYQTADSLAGDIQRYLKDETVSARPPSRAYQFGKLVTRHKIEFAALGIVMATLVAGLSISTWSLARERRAHHDAELARGDADNARKKALTALTRSEAASKFMDDMLLGIGPSVANGRDTTLLREIFDKAAERVERELTNQPDVQADLRYTIARAYGTLRLFERQEPLLRSALAFYRRTPGAEQKVAETLSGLSLMHSQLVPPKLKEAEEEAREALEKAKLQGGENLEVVRMKTRLALVIHDPKRLTEAEAYFREALDAGRRLGMDKSDELLDARNGLARALILQGKSSEAEPLLRESLSVAEEVYGTNHLVTANCLFHLALLREAQAKLEQAEELYRQCLAIRRRLVSRDHRLLEGSLTTLGMVLYHEEKWKEATDVFSELLDLLRQQYGDKDARVVRAMSFLTEVLTADGNDVRFGQLAAEFPQAWFERGVDLARHGEWPEALAAASNYLEVRPHDPNAYYVVAHLLVQAGNRAAYEKLCARIIAECAGTTNPVTADRMAKACLVLPRPGADLKAVAELAETAVTRGQGDSSALPYFQSCKALAEYRLGNLEGATNWATRAAANTSPHVRAQANATLAMAQFQLKHADDARDALNKCTEVVATELPKLTDKNLGTEWPNLIIAHALESEAKRMIEGEPSPAGQTSKLSQ